MILHDRLKMIFSQEELARVHIVYYSDSFVVIADVHNLGCKEARVFINNIINVSRTKCSITIIHGFRHGTDIKEMLEIRFENPHIKSKHPDPFNPGRTHLFIA